MRVNWSDLPKDLLASISGCLETDIDILRFRSVCTSWRSSVPPVYKKWPIQLPVWVSPNDRNNKEIPGYFSLTESIICRLERVDESSSSSMNQEGNASSSTPKLTGCWLVKVQKKTPEKMRILPLLSNHRICHLPEFFPKVINSSNFHISVISKAYDMEYKQTEVKDIYFCGDYYSLQADKVVLSSNPAGDYAFMALHSGGRLGFLRAGDHKWSVLNDIWTCYEDIISYEGGFCAVDILGKAVAFDLSFKASDMAPALGGRMGSKKNLVEMKSTGDLLLVVRYSKDVLGLDCCTIVVQFKVYKLNRETQRWNEVKNLGDEALFVGKDCSFSVSVQDFPGLKGNCIFYNEQAFRRRNKTSDAFKEFLSHDTGVCNLEDGTLRPLAAYPQCCSLFWPPSKLE